ncbi:MULTISPECIES: MerR family transcriptional regulator [Sphingosinicellaceae]|uniref:MerR family transcriptional regulator n=1 Tax=Sphingosinicellaceae TaxID=2820280 RepID=UPI001C1DFF02|nr:MULTISPECIES: MerR family transcriptional regulator [Polymorphobacter]QYE36081.1 MerR family transcriptional regulator [Polymorphobacter sp. PAMC 29334]UAJ10345.1 MerR family transcriptional regulator [Polymorphobacter megasporae]
MRMRELEARSGVGRETIRFYIREGLLPEPARAARNSASYSEAHVTRLVAIKRLQEERFLPLAVIRGLLDRDDAEGGSDAERWLEPEAFPGLDAVLRSRIDLDAPRVPAAVALAASGLDAEMIDEAVANAIVTVDAAGTMTARDAAILRTLGDLDRIGFSREHGFTPGMIRMYHDFIDYVTTQEMRFFFEHTAGQVDEPKAADMAELGIGAVNDLLALMRTRALLAKLERRRRVANDR